MPVFETLLVLTMYVLVAACLTRMVNHDFVFEWLRLFVDRRAATALESAQSTDRTTVDYVVYANRYNRWTVAGDFLVCPYCLGFWVCLALAPAPILILSWSWWTLAALPFAASHLVGIGDRLVSVDDGDQ